MSEPLNKQKKSQRGGIHRLSVSQIIHKDLHLKCCINGVQQQTEANSKAHLLRSHQLLDSSLALTPTSSSSQTRCFMSLR